MGVRSNLKKILEQEGRKQNYLVRELGLSATSVSQLCKEESTPKLETALKISKLLDRKIEDIWDLDE